MRYPRSPCVLQRSVRGPRAVELGFNTFGKEEMLQASAQSNDSAIVAPGVPGLRRVRGRPVPVLLRRRDASVLALRLRAALQGPDGEREQSERECENAGEEAKGWRRQRLTWLPGHPRRTRARAVVARLLTFLLILTVPAGSFLNKFFFLR